MNFVVKRMCRVCMADDWNGTSLIPIFQNHSKSRIASDIFTISRVQIVDYQSCPALICMKCIEDLSRAIIFRNRCRSTDQFLKDAIGSAELKNSTDFKNDVEVLNLIKSEPMEMETFFEPYSSFSAEAVLNGHSLGNQDVPKITNRIKSHQCPHCEQLLSSDHALRNHVSAIHGRHLRKKLTCQVCGKTFAFKSKYDQHYRKVHSEKTEATDIGCHYCCKFFDQKTSLKDHIRYKHEVYDFICDGCGKPFSLKNKLIKHFREEHSKARPQKLRIKKEPKEVQCFPCFVCGKLCVSKTFLKVHERSHVKISPNEYFYCDLCGNKFRSKNPLELHIKTRHILKLRYTCDKCPGKSWARKDHMKRHVKVVHENIREFKCDWCHKDFPERRKLECHIRIHTGEQPFACHFCGKKYTHETDYRRHIWSHTGERKYKCTSCRISFNKRSELIAHRSDCVYYNYNQNNVNI